MACVCVWIGAGFTNPGGKRGKWDMCVFWLRWCWGEWVGGLGQGLGGCAVVKFVFVVSLDSLC